MNVLGSVLGFFDKVKTTIQAADTALDFVEALKHPEAKDAKNDLIKSVVMGVSPLLEAHDVEQLTPDENVLLDEATEKLLELGLRVAARKAQEAMGGGQ